MNNKSKVSEEQMLVIVEFMEKHGDISNLLKKVEGKARRSELWEELSSILSQMGGGAIKPTKKWIKAEIEPNILQVSPVEVEVEYLNCELDESENIPPDIPLTPLRSQNYIGTPAGPQRKRRREVEVHSDTLTSTDPDRARLLASCETESGGWLKAYPSPSLGTLLDKNTLRISVGLRIGTELCKPHICVCGSLVDPFGHHGLSCVRSAGRVSRHAALNNIIKRALASINVPSTLEPSGVFRNDGKRPDGMSLIPWSQGKCLIWDATCCDTLAPSYLHSSAQGAGSAAAKAENRKKEKYSNLEDYYLFSAFAVETLGPWSKDTKQLMNQIGHQLNQTLYDTRASSFLAMNISLAIQRGNAVSVLGTVGSLSGFDELNYLP